jgi:signal recognition particle subunit SRP54
MLGLLTEKMQALLSKLAGKSKLTEENISDAVSEVRLALLEADVNYSVVKNLLKRVKDQALGDAVIKSVTPGQQFIKIVHDELVSLMGGHEEGLALQQPGGLAVVMVCGLQGSGKTTACVKLARYLIKQGLVKKPLIAACDLQRPAAIEQLKRLSAQIDVPVSSLEGEKEPLKVASLALSTAKKERFDLLIVDTAGRLHIDEVLMSELEKMKELLKPHEVLFVANAALGQDAVNTAAEFHKRVGITGSILTMLDGNARGGAAISIREVTGKPLKFEGVGERVEDLQSFNPTSMAHRILGMGDTINLVRKAQEHIDEDQAKKLEEKMRDASFTFSDYLSQMGFVKKMGSLKGLLSMLPGASQFKDFDFNEKEFFKIEAIIQSMTPDERELKCELTHLRRQRIAKGSGTKVDQVNKLVKSFQQMRKLFKNMPMKGMKKMMGGSLWG